MAKVINGVPAITGAGAVKNNMPASPAITRVAEGQVYNGVVQPDWHATNPGVIV